MRIVDIMRYIQLPLYLTKLLDLPSQLLVSPVFLVIVDLGNFFPSSATEPSFLPTVSSGFFY